MGRVVGIDFGLKRIGVASTDALRISVNGKGTYDQQAILPFMENFLREETVDKIVIGMPSGPSEEFVRGVNTFVLSLREISAEVEIEFHDEDFTSQEAVRTMHQMGVKKKQRRNKNLIDEISAVIILQDYLGHRD